MTYLVKQTHYYHWQGSKNNIIQRLEPIIIKPLARKSSLKSEPKLSQGKSKIFVEEVRDNLQ